MIAGRYVLDLFCDDCRKHAQFTGENSGVAKYAAQMDAWKMRKSGACQCKDCRDKRGAWPKAYKQEQRSAAN